MLSSPGIERIAGQLGFAPVDDVRQRAANAAEVIDRVIGPFLHADQPESQFDAQSERALDEALRVFTPAQVEVVRELGRISEEVNSAAFAWSIALNGLVPRIRESTLHVMPRQALDQLEIWRMELADQRVEAENFARNPTVHRVPVGDAELDSALLELLRARWFERLRDATDAWTADDRARLIQEARIELAPLGITEHVWL